MKYTSCFKNILQSYPQREDVAAILCSQWANILSFVQCAASVPPRQLFWPIVKTSGISYRCHAGAWNCRAVEPDGFGSVCESQKRSHPNGWLLFGDPYGNRTHVTAVKGRCLNRLTNGPGSGNLTRTDDTPGMNRMLYQLSYAAIYCCVSQQEILYRQRCDLSTTFVRFFRGFRKFFLSRQPIRPKRRPGRGPRRAHGGADYADLRPRRRP